MLAAPSSLTRAQAWTQPGGTTYAKLTYSSVTAADRAGNAQPPTDDNDLDGTNPIGEIPVTAA